MQDSPLDLARLRSEALYRDLTMRFERGILRSWHFDSEAFRYDATAKYHPYDRSYQSGRYLTSLSLYALHRMQPGTPLQHWGNLEAREVLAKATVVAAFLLALEARNYPANAYNIPSRATFPHNNPDRHALAGEPRGWGKASQAELRFAGEMPPFTLYAFTTGETLGGLIDYLAAFGRLLNLQPYLRKANVEALLALAGQDCNERTCARPARDAVRDDWVRLRDLGLRIFDPATAASVVWGSFTLEGWYRIVFAHVEAVLAYWEKLVVWSSGAGHVEALPYFPYTNSRCFHDGSSAAKVNVNNATNLLAYAAFRYARLLSIARPAVAQRWISLTTRMAEEFRSHWRVCPGPMQGAPVWSYAANHASDDHAMPNGWGEDWIHSIHSMTLLSAAAGRSPYGGAAWRDREGHLVLSVENLDALVRGFDDWWTQAGQAQLVYDAPEKPTVATVPLRLIRYYWDFNDEYSGRCEPYVYRKERPAWLTQDGSPRSPANLNKTGYNFFYSWALVGQDEPRVLYRLVQWVEAAGFGVARSSSGGRLQTLGDRIDPNVEALSLIHLLHALARLHGAMLDWPAAEDTLHLLQPHPQVGELYGAR